MSLPLAVLVASACGSDESDGSSSKCAQGATRACLGPGACNGAQSCDASGAWSACDCGGGGGSGGGGSGGVSGGSGSGGATDGSAGSPSGGSGGSGGSGAAGGSGGSGGSTSDSGSDAADGGPGPNDDPCPTQQLYSDCSDQCGGKWPCQTTTYPQACTVIGAAVNSGIFGNHITFRTPTEQSLVGADPCYCAQSFDLPTASSVSIQYIGSVIGARIRAGKPWKVRIYKAGASTASDCLTADFKNGCATVPFGVQTNAEFIAATDDPNAPARNVIIDEGACAPADFWQ